jgi:hypothetical protein
VNCRRRSSPWKKPPPHADGRGANGGTLDDRHSGADSAPLTAPNFFRGTACVAGPRAARSEQARSWPICGSSSRMARSTTPSAAVLPQRGGGLRGNDYGAVSAPLPPSSNRKGAKLPARGAAQQLETKILRALRPASADLTKPSSPQPHRRARRRTHRGRNAHAGPGVCGDDGSWHRRGQRASSNSDAVRAFNDTTAATTRARRHAKPTVDATRPGDSMTRSHSINGASLD